MRILITGITGFVGGHLVEALGGRGHALFGLCRRGQWPLRLQHLAGTAELIAGELTDARRVSDALAHARPDWIIHLAGYASPGKSILEPDLCWNDNLTATRTLYDRVVAAGLRPRILFLSSGLVYGEPDEPDGSCDERTTLKPATPYAASKAAADLMSYQYGRNPGLDIVRARLFNQIGPGQTADYAIPNFCRQIAAAEAGRQPPVLETGDLSARRDITDVRDTVAAFPLLLEHGKSGEAYNAGRGEAFAVGDMLNRLLAMARVRMEVRQRDTGRKADTTVTRADPSKLRRATGWVPRIELDRTLADILDEWRKAT